MVRGTLARSSSAFRLGAGAAVMYLATTWPAVFGAWTAIDQYNLFTHAGCQKFFLGKVWSIVGGAVPLVARRLCRPAHGRVRCRLGGVGAAG